MSSQQMPQPTHQPQPPTAPPRPVTVIDFDFEFDPDVACDETHWHVDGPATRYVRAHCRVVALCGGCLARYQQLVARRLAAGLPMHCTSCDQHVPAAGALTDLGPIR